MHSLLSSRSDSALKARAEWFADAGPIDYIIAGSQAAGAIPVVGKHLRQLGAVTAMSMWGYKHAPDFAASALRALLAPGAGELRKQQRAQTHEVLDAGLRGLIAPERCKVDWPAADRWAPVLRASQQRKKYLYRSSVPYGDAPGQLIDVWRRRDLTGPAPVLLFVPGGAWVHGGRQLQGYALMSQLAEQGWVCLSAEYRVSPNHAWPRHITDVKAAIAWARANVDRFGGDRDFLAVAGCSAGGHLAALAGLTPDDPDFHGDLPADADTSVDAVVGIYGRYDWEDRSTIERERFMNFLESVVVKKRYHRRPDVFRAASPIARVRPDAPPFLVVHGSSDSVIPVPQARAFVEKMRETSRSPVGYVELPGAGHGFDMTDGARTTCVAMAIGLFLDEIHRSHALRSAKEVI